MAAMDKVAKQRCAAAAATAVGDRDRHRATAGGDGGLLMGHGGREGQEGKGKDADIELWNGMRSAFMRSQVERAIDLLQSGI